MVTSLLGICSIWDNKRVNGLLIYGKNIDCQLSPRVDSSYYYYIRVHLNGKKDKFLFWSKLVTLIFAQLYRTGIFVTLKKLRKALSRDKSRCE